MATLKLTTKHRIQASLPTLLLAAAVAGCGTAEPEVAYVPPAPTPEEQFATIVETLETRLSDPDLGGTTLVSEFDAPPGTPIADARVQVEHQMTPPSEEGEPYRGAIAFSMVDPKVTVVLPLPTEEEKAAAKAKEAARVAELKSQLGDGGGPDIESLIVPSTETLADRLGSSPVHEIEPGESKRVYELEHRDGHWVLLTEPDREKEPFYASMIEFAVSKQQ